MQQRNANIDMLKGVAITLVIWGHVMQLMCKDPMYHDNYIWKAIYCFHMPLFMFLSGYVSVGAVARDFKVLAKSRFWSLFVPLIIWSGVLYVIKLAIGYSHFDGSSAFGIFKSLASGFIYEYWFVWVLLYNIFIMNIIHRVCKKAWAVWLSVLLIWLIPETIIPYVHYLKTMYPFFVVGYMVSKNRSQVQWLKSNYFLIAAVPLFIACSIYYSGYTTMFIPPKFLDVWNPRAHYLFISMYYVFFLTAGFSGIFLCYKLVRMIPVRSVVGSTLTDVGRYTLIMYLVQGLWFFSFCRQYSYHVPYHTLMFVSGVVITYVVYRIGKWIANNGSTAFLAGKKQF